MSRATDAAIDHQNSEAELEVLYAEREELAALEWVAKNPRKALVAVVLASPKYQESKPNALHS